MNSIDFTSLNETLKRMKLSVVKNFCLPHLISFVYIIFNVA